MTKRGIFGGGRGLLSSSLRNIKALLIYETGSLGFTDAPRSFNDLQRRPPRRESADAHVGIQHSLKRRKNLNRELISARREHDAAHKDNLPQKATVQARKNQLLVIKVAEKTTA